MNILFDNGSLGANRYILKAYINAISVMGHNVILWNDSDKSVYDIFYEAEQQFNNIDLFMGHTWRLTKGLVKNLIARPNIKVILRASHYGDLDDTIDRKTYPVGIATDEEKRLVEELKAGQPNFQYVTCQYSQTQMELCKSHNRWSNIGLQTKGILLCADTIDYFYNEPDDNYKADIFFCGGFWNYKQKYLSWMLGLCYPNIPLKTVICGHGGWSTPSYVGSMSESSIRKFYASSLVSPNLFEPHSLEQYSDINSRTFQISACAGFQISMDAIGLEEIFPKDEIVLAYDRKDFYEKVLYFINKPEERIPYIKKAVQRIYSQHTGFHRTATVLDLLGYKEESQKALNIAEEEYSRVKEQVNEIA